MKKIIAFEVLGDYRVHLRFDDGVDGIVNLSRLVGQGVFGAWRDYDLFRRAHLTAQGALSWPGELELCPDALFLEVTGLHAEDIFPNLKCLGAHA